MHYFTGAAAILDLSAYCFTAPNHTRVHVRTVYDANVEA